MYPIVETRYQAAVRSAMKFGKFRSWTNQPCSHVMFNEDLTERPSQIRTRPVPMTEEEVREVRKRTGSSPYFEKKFVPVAHGRPRSQTRRKKA